jgi:hypothetical protein
MQASRCWSRRLYCENANRKPLARTADAQTILGKHGEVSIGSSQKLKLQETLARTAVTEHWPTANVFLASYRPAERSAAAGLCVAKQMSQ